MWIIKSINLPEGLVAIYDNAFMETKSLESVTFPTTLEIMRVSFYGSGLKNIVIPGNVKIIEGGTFQQCQNLRSVTLEEGVTSIASNAFRSATNLNTVNLPTTLKSIGDSAFYDCAITSIDLSSVETLGAGCLYSNNELREVILSNKCTSIGDRAFYSSATGITINLTFKGTIEEFESISKGDLWNKLGTDSQIVVSFVN